MCPALSRNGTKKRREARPKARDSENRRPLQARPRNRFAIGGNSGILSGAGAGFGAIAGARILVTPTGLEPVFSP
jgi:hypothetical protein